LQRVGHQPNFVEEDGAAVRHLQKAGFSLARVGERTALESEQLGFEQRIGDRGAIHVYERQRRARPGLVDQLRDESLACAGLALNQHRRQPPLRPGLAGEQPRELIADDRKRRARAKQLIQHELTILTARGPE
jgi:hypothetical protein